MRIWSPRGSPRATRRDSASSSFHGGGRDATSSGMTHRSRSVGRRQTGCDVAAAQGAVRRRPRRRTRACLRCRDHVGEDGWGRCGREAVEAVTPWCSSSRNWAVTRRTDSGFADAVAQPFQCRGQSGSRRAAECPRPVRSVDHGAAWPVRGSSSRGLVGVRVGAAGHPVECLAMLPPTVHADFTSPGSGPSLRPYGASRR